MNPERFGLQVQDRWSDPDGRLHRKPVPLSLEEVFAAAARAGFSAAMIVPESSFPLFATKGPIRLDTVCTFIFAQPPPARAEEPSRPALPTLPEAS